MAYFDNPSFDGHQACHYVSDDQSGLKAIIAIHSTALGPAAGGCRLWTYVNEEAALVDALRLSKGMSFKNALAGLPLGGGKAVILQNKAAKDREALFEAFGRAVNSLGGSYVTAEDVGVSVADMDVVARHTSFVSGLTAKDAAGASGDPSPKTAKGVFYGVRAAAKFALGRNDLEGLKVAVQGLGGVGSNLCRELSAAGAKLWVSDVNKDRVTNICDQYHATPVDTDEILFQDVNVVAPCALGAVLDTNSIEKLQSKIVAGGANNQLRSDKDGERLRQRGILFAPDYVINAGGIINVAAEYLGTMSKEDVETAIAAIEPRLANIFEKSKSSNMPTNIVANDMARRIISGPAKGDRLNAVA